MGLKQLLMEQAFRVMEDPRVMQAVRDPRVVQALMGAIQLRAKVQRELEEQVQRVARQLNLATEAEVRELRRMVRRLERELDAAHARADERSVDADAP